MRRSARFFLALILFGATPLSAVTVNDYAAGTTTFNGERILYRLFTPKNMVQGQRYPLVLTLHGAGEGITTDGDPRNNTAQLSNGAINWATEANQAARPCFVFSPQTGSGWSGFDWGTGVCKQANTISKSLATVMHILDSLVKVLPIDTNRLYITGLSMGGMGTWDLIMRYPGKFAAAVPVCGAVDTTKLTPIAAHRIWTYHGSADGIINPLGTRTAMRKLVALGQPVLFPKGGAVAPNPTTTMTPANLLVALPTAQKLYTEIADGGHGAWDVAYVDTMMFRWLFLQAKAATTDLRVVHSTQTRTFVNHGAFAELISFSGRRIGKEQTVSHQGMIIGRDGKSVIRMSRAMAIRRNR